MEIIQEIGSYAGLAAIVGLAVLSALYFSQARDVKRLREWAGRAPERAAQPAQPVVPQRVVAQPQPKPVGATPGAPQPAPAAQEAGQATTPKPPAIPPHIPGTAPAIAASAGARPATATAAAAAATATAERPGGSGAATPAGQGKQAPADGAVPAPGADTPKPEAATTTADEKKQADGTQQDSTESQSPAAIATAQPPVPATTPAQAPAPSPSGAATPAGQARPTPPTPPRISRPALPPRPVPQPTAIIPPGSPDSPNAAGRRLPRSRVIALVVAGVLVLGGGAAFAVSQLTGDDGKQASESAGSADSGGGDGGTKPDGGKAVNPSEVTVAVLNGTLVPGLAAAIGDEVEKLGFDLGTLGNADNQEQQRAESVVLYASGHKREAVVVSRRLKIPQREAIDPDTQALAGDAGVVVVAGGDQTP